MFELWLTTVFIILNKNKKIVKTNNGDNMISRHECIGDTIYLYFDYNYEFGKLDIPKNEKSYLDTIKDYIKKIKFTGTKIVVMVGTIVVITISLNQQKFTLTPSKTNTINQGNEIVEIIQPEIDDTFNEGDKINEESQMNLENKEEIVNDDQSETINQNVEEQEQVKQEETKEISQEQTNEKSQEQDKKETQEQTKENLITIQHNGNIINIELEEYIVGVVAAEIPASFHMEALKAQSVIARTYAINKINKGIMLTDNNSTQNYIDISQMKNKWGGEFDKYYAKINTAVQSTKGITVKYNGQYIDAVYSSTSNGYTEDSVNVWGNQIPYLKTVESPWDRNATSYLRTQAIDLDTVNSKLGTTVTNKEQISIISRNNSGRVSQIQFGEKIFSGVEFRNILGLRSADFDIELNDNQLTITTRGYGHGVGMSQYGANGMANEGYNYEQILNHYYQNITIG